MSDHCDFCFADGGEWAHGVWMCAHCEYVLVTKVKFIMEDLA